MTPPRKIIVYTTYKVSRRVLLRMFLLVPLPVIKKIFRYCLGVVRARHSVLLHAYVVMSNHYHLVCTDPLGELPRFMHDLNYLLARTLNDYHSRAGQFFEAGSYSAVAVTHDSLGLDNECQAWLPDDTDYSVFDDVLFDDEADIHSAIHYVLLNPVRAGLVSRRDEWPGLISTYQDIADGKLIEATRPEQFFDAENEANPDAVAFALDPLPSWADLTPAEVQAECDAQTAKLDAKEADLRAEFAEQGRKFLGRQGVLSTDPYSSPKTREQKGKLNPQVAGKSALKSNPKLLLRVLLLVAFRRAYRAALLKLRKTRDIANAEFPRGTYWFRYFHGMPVKHPELCVAPATPRSPP